MKLINGGKTMTLEEAEQVLGVLIASVDDWCEAHYGQAYSGTSSLADAIATMDAEVKCLREAGCEKSTV